MFGAMFGDIVGSRFEFHNCRSKSFELFHPDCSFTDDTLMTLAVADALVNAGGADEQTLTREVICSMKAIAAKYPDSGWGLWFLFLIDYQRNAGTVFPPSRRRRKTCPFSEGR